jgi:hypothetical protein
VTGLPPERLLSTAADAGDDAVVPTGWQNTRAVILSTRTFPLRLVLLVVLLIVVVSVSQVVRPNIRRTVLSC